MPGPQTLAEQGRAARSRRAVIRHHITNGQISVPRLLEGHEPEDVEAEAMNMRVAVLLEQVPGIGQPTVDKILNDAGCPPARRLGELTTAARSRIAAAVRNEITR